MGKISRQLRDYSASAGSSVLARLLRRIEYERASDWGGRLGRVGYLLIRKHRLRAIQNLTRIYGNKKSSEELKGMVKAMFENLFRSGFECVAYGNLPDEKKREYVQIIGEKNLDEALSAGRGVIAVTAHMGNFLILMTRLALEGYSVDLLVKRMKDKRLEHRLNNLRKDFGFNSIYVSPKIRALKASVLALKNNHVLVILGDQKWKDGVKVKFFGMPAMAAAGPISLALLTGAPVLPMFMVRNPDVITHRLYIEGPMELTRTGSKDKDIAVNVQKYTDVIQSYVEKYPAQWIWNHKRWNKC